MMQETLAPWEQLPMYAISDELAPMIEQYGLSRNLDELRKNGYTVIEVDRELTDRIRIATLRAVEGAPGPNSSFDLAFATPIGEDPVFEEACTHPAVLALTEYICGHGCTLSSVLATVRTAGSALGLHCDQSQVPAPFPEHMVNLTACWVTDEFTKANGAFMIIPGTQLQRRNPTPEEGRALEGAIAVECPPGSVVLWDGAVWHGNYPRTEPGQRVVLHVTYTRIAYRPVHDFSYLTEDFWANASPQIRALLGENLGFGANSRFVHIDAERYMRMAMDVRR
jgi:Phytanoyl-CoA dioxygenase (PhyH)